MHRRSARCTILYGTTLVAVHRRLVVAPAHEPLDGEHRVLGVGDRPAAWPPGRPAARRDLVKPTTDGVSRLPSALVMTIGSPPSITATHRVGRPQVYADDFRHDSSRIGRWSVVMCPWSLVPGPWSLVARPLAGPCSAHTYRARSILTRQPAPCRYVPLTARTRRAERANLSLRGGGEQSRCLRHAFRHLSRGPLPGSARRQAPETPRYRSE